MLRDEGCHLNYQVCFDDIHVMLKRKHILNYKNSTVVVVVVVTSLSLLIIHPAEQQAIDVRHVTKLTVLNLGYLK
jgi:hypothetical protein